MHTCTNTYAYTATSLLGAVPFGWQPTAKHQTALPTNTARMQYYYALQYWAQCGLLATGHGCQSAVFAAQQR